MGADTSKGNGEAGWCVCMPCAAEKYHPDAGAGDEPVATPRASEDQAGDARAHEQVSARAQEQTCIEPSCRTGTSVCAALRF